ncbi:MAG: hypothetical protein IJO79_01100 [Firmicutes bacterium]|nr:hypothetical protein [Bacillota bacterium]
MHKIGYIDIEKYSCIAEDITTDEVIITDERIRHIKTHHPGVYEEYGYLLQQAVEGPDVIIRDPKPSTALILFQIQKDGQRVRICLRLATSTDDPSFKNSVITFMRVRKKEWDRLISNKEVLYRKE